MAALSANTTYTFWPCGEAKWESGVPGDADKFYPEVASAATIYKGSIVVYDAAGYAIPNASQASGTKIIGIAMEARDNSAGTNGALTVPVLRSRVIVDALDITSAAQAYEGDILYIGATDNLEDCSLTQTNNCPPIGFILQDQTSLAVNQAAIIVDPMLSVQHQTFKA